MRRPAVIAVLAFAAAALVSGGLSGGATLPPPSKCGMVVFRPNSGDGAFDIRARSITCATARAKVRAARGEPKALKGWRCTLLRRDEVTGAGRYACTSRGLVHGRVRTRLIAWWTGN